MSAPVSTSLERGSIPSPFPFTHKLLRVVWGLCWAVAFRPSPKVLYGWRRMLLRMMGARIGRGAVIDPSVKVWYPPNLIMEPYSTLGPYVDCYSVAPVTIGRCATVSQYSYLCAATHDYTDLKLPLIPKPISIGTHAWVCAAAFVGPGVTVGDGAVVGARSSVFKDVEPWTVVAGNPARFLKTRVLKKST